MKLLGKKELFSWNYVNFIEEILVVCSSSMVFFFIGIAIENTVGLVQAVALISMCYFAEKECLWIFMQSHKK